MIRALHRAALVCCVIATALSAACARDSADFSITRPAGWQQTQSTPSSIVLKSSHEEVLAFSSQPAGSGTADIRKWNVKAALQKQHFSITSDQPVTLCRKIPARYVHAVSYARGQQLANVSAVSRGRLYTAAYFYASNAEASPDASKALLSMCPAP